MFKSYNEWGKDAELRTSAENRREFYRPMDSQTPWDSQWDGQFTNEDKRLDIETKYASLLSRLPGELGIPNLSSQEARQISVDQLPKLVPWPVHGKIVGKKDKKSTDVSGIACTRDEGFPRVCLVIDDDVQSAQLVTVEDGTLEAGATIRLIDDEHDGKALELDGEGVAYADGFFYVIGSNGHPRDKEHKLDTATIAARTAATSQIVRIYVDPQTGWPMPNDAGAVTRSVRLKPISPNRDQAGTGRRAAAVRPDAARPPVRRTVSVSASLTLEQ